MTYAARDLCDDAWALARGYVTLSPVGLGSYAGAEAAGLAVLRAWRLPGPRRAIEVPKLTFALAVAAIAATLLRLRK